MSLETKFEQQFPTIANTELWKLLKEKVEAENLPTTFLEAVGNVCEHGITLSKDIIRFFPNFTLHDEVHIANVCKWMIRLLDERKNELCACEAALLVMAACCHDIGMSVSREQERKLCSNTQTTLWKEYFKQHLKDDEEFSNTGQISPRMLRSYIRINHHKRIGEQIKVTDWPTELNKQGINRKVLLDLCQSHGEELKLLDVPNGISFDLRLCAVLLRLADILDFDSSRAPNNLFTHLGLDNPENFEEIISQTEWAKNRAVVFGHIKDGVLPFTASFTNLQLECEVQYYLDWVQKELDSSSEYLSKYAGKWQSLVLPRKISTDSVERNGYRFGKFCLTMDQDRILELLTGRNLYSDPGVFVRELLQNSIDAVLTRSRLDPYFKEADGKIIIRSWVDNDGFSWFRIEDNGTGMNENIITNYFLKVGRSYYTSDDFKADKRHYGRGEDYTPISRFGIGVLSCFMSNPEQNLLEVSTKRYSQDQISENPAIRLNVTGLHGYYYLAQEAEQDENDEFFQSIHNPQNESEGYRTEVGTTICVRVNLYQLGGYRSFKEIVDKYVQFPRVSVEYIGPEGKYIYPTHSELMDTVHNLNPEGADEQPTEYVYPITDEQFAKLKEDMPDTIWVDTPKVIFKYYPLDWLSGDDNIGGVAVYAELRAEAQTPSFNYQGNEISPEFSCSIENGNLGCVLNFAQRFEHSINREMEVLQEHLDRNEWDEFVYEIFQGYPIYGKDVDWLNYMTENYQVSTEQIQSKYEEMQKLIKDRDILEHYNQLSSECSIYISYDELLGQWSEGEVEVFQHVTGGLRGAKQQLSENKSIMLTAYNGILADTRNLFDKSKKYIGIILLLQNEWCPEVNLARNIISNFPLELACTLALMKHALPDTSFWYNVETILQKQQFVMVCEREFQQLLKKHPEWEKYIQINEKSITELKESLETEEKLSVDSIHRRSLYSYLCMVTLKQYFRVFMDSSYCWHNLCIENGSNEDIDADFPVMLSFTFTKNKSMFGCQLFHKMYCYNREHCFMQWLIQQRQALQEEVPGVYNDILRTMILSDSQSEILETINATLTRLKNYKNNLFNVSDILFLSEDDWKATD